MAVGADDPDAVLTSFDDAEEIGPSALQNSLVGCFVRHAMSPTDRGMITSCAKNTSDGFESPTVFRPS
jgi:hypothetical protein